MWLTQNELAAAVDRSRSAVAKATKNDHICGGLRVRKYATREKSGKVAGYEIPEPALGNECLERLRRFREEQRRQNPVQNEQPSNGTPDLLEGISTSTNGEQRQDWRGEMARALGDNATPVSGLGAGAFAVRGLSEAIRQNPEVFDQLFPVLFAGIGGGIGYYGGGEGDETSAAMGLIGLFGGYTIYQSLRYMIDQAGKDAEQQRQLQGRQTRALPQQGRRGQRRQQRPNMRVVTGSQRRAGLV